MYRDIDCDSLDTLAQESKIHQSFRLDEENTQGMSNEIARLMRNPLKGLPTAVKGSRF